MGQTRLVIVFGVLLLVNLVIGIPQVRARSNPDPNCQKCCGGATEPYQGTNGHRACTAGAYGCHVTLCENHSNGGEGCLCEYDDNYMDRCTLDYGAGCQQPWDHGCIHMGENQ